MVWKDNKYGLNRGVFCKDKFLDLHSPKIMGVVNVTPDSFYKESRKYGKEVAFHTIEKMIKEGVDIIDIGGMSTRPHAELLSEKEEINRVLPLIKEVHRKYPEALLSIDTFRSNVARLAIENGAHIINDVYGGRVEDKMLEVVAELNVPYILMHCRGDASNMQNNCNYKDVTEEVFFELSEQLRKLRRKGVKDVIIDPGFGFAKDINQNYSLFKRLSYFHLLDCPLLIGVSRKSMIYKYFKTSPSEALNGTTVLNTISLFEMGASIIRVHDVKEAKEIKEIVALLENN